MTSVALGDDDSQPHVVTLCCPNTSKWEADGMVMTTTMRTKWEAHKTSITDILWTIGVFFFPIHLLLLLILAICSDEGAYGWMMTTKGSETKSSRDIHNVSWLLGMFFITYKPFLWQRAPFFKDLFFTILTPLSTIAVAMTGAQYDATASWAPWYVLYFWYTQYEFLFTHFYLQTVFLKDLNHNHNRKRHVKWWGTGIFFGRIHSKDGVVLLVD